MTARVHDTQPLKKGGRPCKLAVSRKRYPDTETLDSETSDFETSDFENLIRYPDSKLIGGRQG